MSSHTPETHPEIIPTNLQWSDLDGDPMIVDREKLTPLENLVIDVYSWINEVRFAPVDEDLLLAPPAHYRYVGRPDITKPDDITFGVEEVEAEDDDDVAIRQTAAFFWGTETQAFRLTLLSNVLPTLADNDDGPSIQFVLRSLSLDFATETGNISLDSSTQPNPDPEVLAVLRDAFENAQSILESGYELELDEE